LELDSLKVSSFLLWATLLGKIVNLDFVKMAEQSEAKGTLRNFALKHVICFTAKVLEQIASSSPDVSASCQKQSCKFGKLS
jgi:hypothetical protein